MSEDKKKDLKPKKWFKNIRGYKRFLLFTGIYIGLFLILLAGSAEYTSRPAFCPTCHYMETFYQSWRTSAHNKIDCVECHFEPGISGTVRGKLNGLVQIVNYVSLSYKKRKPWAEIPDNTCARSGCHEKQALQDTLYNFKGVMFSHKNHLSELKRGKTLKCTSCHSQIVQGTHIEVTEQTCFGCHFKKSDDPEHNTRKLTLCTNCHKWENKSKDEMASYRYNHTMVVENKIECQSCHNKVVSGNGEVGKERCFQCHFENDRLEKYNNTEFLHTTHISKHSMKCSVCHSPIEHKIQKIEPNSPADCQSCHTDAHTYQVNLYSGEGGFDVEKSPSAMYLNGINCKGCHVFHETDKRDIKTEKAGAKSCEKCHGPGYDNLLTQWETASIKRVGIINILYNNVEKQIKNSGSSNKSEAETILDQAKHNIRIVEIGKSVHNVQFADKLLVAAYTLLKKTLTIIGSKVNLPEFSSSSEFIPNECYNCHSGIQEINVKKFDMNFSHNQHIVKEKIICAKCHSNSQRHGELIQTKETCNSCHHAKGKNNDACQSCHSFQANVYNGNFAGMNQPDYMKEGGVGCIDCHISTDKVFLPDEKICLKCHDDSYKQMATEWKNDIKKLIKDAETELRNVKNLSPDEEQQAVISDTKKILSELSTRPSIYVHNYDLLSSVLTKHIKKLREIK